MAVPVWPLLECSSRVDCPADIGVLASKTMAKTLPMILPWDESFDLGSDTPTGVNDADDQPPFRFTGTLNKLTIKIDHPQ